VRSPFRFLSLSLAMAPAFTACGGHSPSAFAPGDASPAPDDAAADGPVPCGSSTLVCGPAQYCVVGCVDEGPVLCSPLDGGACPPGTGPSNACGDAAPCRSAPTVFPTKCVDDAGEAPCPYPDVEGRTIRCNCTL
jgi:hypothetical protein